MNKRQKKKAVMKMIKGHKVRALVKIDLSHVTNNSHVDVYIPSKYEAKDESEFGIINSDQGKKISFKRAEIKGKNTLVNFCSGHKKSVSATIWLEDKPFPYAIRTKNN